jgi:hypothetical protein
LNFFVTHVVPYFNAVNLRHIMAALTLQTLVRINEKTLKTYKYEFPLLAFVNQTATV